MVAWMRILEKEGGGLEEEGGGRREGGGGREEEGGGRDKGGFFLGGFIDCGRMILFWHEEERDFLSSESFSNFSCIRRMFSIKPYILTLLADLILN